MRVRKGRKETRPAFNYNFGSQKVLKFSAQKHSSKFSAQKHFTKILLGYWVVGGGRAKMTLIYLRTSVTRFLK